MLDLVGARDGMADSPSQVLHGYSSQSLGLGWSESAAYTTGWLGEVVDRRHRPPGRARRVY